MSAELEIMGVTTTSEEEFFQPRDEIMDVSQYTEAAIVATVYALNRNGGTTSIRLDTAVDNQDDRFVLLSTVKDLTGDPASYPAPFMIYLAGPGVGTGHPGFARYIRVTLTQVAGASITLDGKAILKP